MTSDIFEIGKHRLVVHGYSTDADRKKALQDMQRVVNMIARMGVDEMFYALEPERKKVMRAVDKEFKQDWEDEVR